MLRSTFGSAGGIERRRQPHLRAPQLLFVRQQKGVDQRQPLDVESVDLLKLAPHWTNELHGRSAMNHRASGVRVR